MKHAVLYMIALFFSVCAYAVESETMNLQDKEDAKQAALLDYIANLQKSVDILKRQVEVQNQIDMLEGADARSPITLPLVLYIYGIEDNLKAKVMAKNGGVRVVKKGDRLGEKVVVKSIVSNGVEVSVVGKNKTQWLTFSSFGQQNMPDDPIMPDRKFKSIDLPPLVIPKSVQ